MNYKLLQNSIFLITPIIILGIFKNEWMGFIGTLVILIIYLLKVSQEKKEWQLAVSGIILGIIMELGGDALYQLQTWNQGSFFGIPLWLPLLWGYAFIFIRNIGNAIIQSQKK